MKKRLKQFSGLLIFSIIFWVISFLIFAITRYHGLDQEYSVFFDERFDIPTSMWLRFGAFLGLSIGIFYAIIEFFFENFLSRNIILGFRIAIKTFVYLVVMISILSTLIFVAEYEMDLDLHYEKGWWTTNKIFWTIILYFIINSLVFSFLKIANEKFGKGVFFNMLIGRYKKPKEENRIFMFLDLKSSTTIAETLGHFKYSELIQDCFLDLNQVVNKYSADVYQYVGDEAVLSWNFKTGIKDNNCIQLYFDFRQKLENKKNYYENKYNFLPEFKAGLHGGKLIVVEVGSVKKEIAYHGDVINTTARIQGECNKYGEWLLISEDLLKKMNLDQEYSSKEIGNVFLKGKNTALNICSINKIEMS